jgi:hypothetical protein
MDWQQCDMSSGVLSAAGRGKLRSTRSGGFAILISEAIAEYLARRGYDREIVSIFACAAMERGRLSDAESINEAAQIVESMFCSIGVQSGITYQRSTNIQKGNHQPTPPLFGGQTATWMVK